MHFVYTQRERERRFFVAFYSNRYRVQAGARNTKRNWKRGGAMSYKYIDIPKKSMRIPLANWFWVFYLSLSFFLFFLLSVSATFGYFDILLKQGQCTQTQIYHQTTHSIILAMYFVFVCICYQLRHRWCDSSITSTITTTTTK